MKTVVQSHIKYSIIELKNGMFQPQREYGDMMLFPAFDSLRDALIYLRAVASDCETGIVGNTQIIRQ